MAKSSKAVKSWVITPEDTVDSITEKSKLSYEELRKIIDCHTIEIHPSRGRGKPTEHIPGSVKCQQMIIDEEGMNKNLPKNLLATKIIAEWERCTIDVLYSIHGTAVVTDGWIVG
jgi:hypothetical protein